MKTSYISLLRSSYTILLAIVLSCTGLTLTAQSFTASETSSHFVKEDEYDSLIVAIAQPMARNKNVSERDFDARYAEQRYQLAETLQPLLQSRFTVLDKTYARALAPEGTPLFTKIKGLYIKEARNIIETVLTGTSLFSGLFEPDNNDRILHFHSDITVLASGTLQVSERITVFNGNGQAGSSPINVSPNDAIQRGITRDFPTSYVDSNGFWSETGFVLKSVFKNGEKEPYITENLSNGILIKAGSREVILEPGIYQYRIDYETDRQLIFHNNKDELYWNVNGNGWSFSADTISCSIHFPAGAVIQEYACYTGFQGSTDRDCNAKVTGNESIEFLTTKRMEPYQGLTIAAAIQKGILSAPGKSEKIISFLKTNYIIPVLGVLLLLLSAFYFFSWSRKGRDPRKGVIYPQFTPPADLTPADTGYIIDQKYGSHLFAATLVDFAVKKQLIIEVEKEGMLIKMPVYYFKRPEDASPPLTTDQYGFSIQTMYGQKAARSNYNSTLKSCYNSLGETLKKRFLIRKGKQNTKSGLFALNRGYTVFGSIVLVIALIFTVFFLVTHPSEKLLVIAASSILAMITMHIFFIRAISAYTVQGRAVADHILGFKMYLEQVEQQVFDQLTPPEKTLELFEKYLPYAIALRVENRWAEKFDSIMQRALADGYQPGYYSLGRSGFSSFSMSDMSRGIASGLAGTISSASTPPSSSSGGSSGGGSSGGGGGGGGGGGW